MKKLQIVIATLCITFSMQSMLKIQKAKGLLNVLRMQKRSYQPTKLLFSRRYAGDSLCEMYPQIILKGDNLLIPLEWIRKDGIVLPKSLFEIFDESRIEDTRKDMLPWAAKNGYIVVVKSLLKKGVAVDAKDYSNNTALHHTAADGYLEIAQYLLEKNASVNARNDDGLTPLQLATNNNHIEMVKLLIRHGSKDLKESYDIALLKGVT